MKTIAIFMSTCHSLCKCNSEILNGSIHNATAISTMNKNTEAMTSSIHGTTTLPEIYRH